MHNGNGQRILVVDDEPPIVDAVATTLRYEGFDVDEASSGREIGDRDRLRQIVDNLLSNVRAHTPREAAVSVRVTSPNGSAVIDVEDRGPGLAADETNRVFERFYRADASRARASGGVGLGLHRGRGRRGPWRHRWRPARAG